MAKRQRPKYFWAKMGLYAFWGLLGVMAIMIIAAYGNSILSGAEAATEGTAAAAFSGTICHLYSYAGTFIASLAVLMTMIAGIIYATSQGEGGGETGIGLAKSMITAVITGVLLYMIGLWLLGGPCGTGEGLIRNILNQTGGGGGASSSVLPGGSLNPSFIPSGGGSTAGGASQQ